MHALAHAINQSLGNVGKTVIYTDPVNANPVNQAIRSSSWLRTCAAAKSSMLFILGGNPIYDAPADLDFADALANTNIPFRVHLGLYQDETAEFCHWHINEADYLEAWGDARAYDGTVSIVQPLIAPLYGGKSAHRICGSLGQAKANPPAIEIVQNYWKSKHAGADFDMSGGSRCMTAGSTAPRLSPKQVSAKTHEACLGCVRAPIKTPSKSTSAAILRSTTAASPTTAGCRNFPSR